jgi:hypothetical protein
VRVEAAQIIVVIEDSGTGAPDEVLPQLGRRLRSFRRESIAARRNRPSPS